MLANALSMYHKVSPLLSGAYPTCVGPSYAPPQVHSILSYHGSRSQAPFALSSETSTAENSCEAKVWANWIHSSSASPVSAIRELVAWLRTMRVNTL